MGVVYEGEDLRLGRHVALKLLPEKLLKDSRALQRFDREARAVSSLNHANICTIYEVEEYKQNPVIVMELLEGESLKERIRKGPVPYDELLDIGIQTASALKAAHAKGIIHRDIKPGNIFIVDDRRVKILDFGLAKLLPVQAAEDKSDQDSLTLEGVIPGTTPYMSPEQIRDEEIDLRSDLFSLGVVLYEMATGQKPFAGKNRTLMMNAILNEKPAAATKVNPRLPARMDAILSKLLVKDRTQRYQQAAEIIDDLKQLKAVPDVLAAPLLPNQLATANARTQVRRLPMHFNGRAAWVAASAVVVLFLGAVGHWISVRQSLVRPQFKTIAVLPLQNYTGDPQQEYFVDGMTDSVIADLGKIQDLRVISRTSVTPYKDLKKSMREIASGLHADAVIEGSVTRSADRVRITVQLIDAARDQHLWAESYEREMKNVLALQSQVAQAIAEQVHAVVTPEEQGHLSKNHVINPDVYELYLKGRHIMERGGLEDVQTAINYFQSGLEKDPANALLYTGLADAYIDKMMDVHESPVEATTKARAAAEKALLLDDSLAEAHTSLGMIKLSYDWDWVGAEHEFKRAMELNPGYPLAYVMYGQYLTMVGRQTDAMPYFENAHRLDPLFGQSYKGEGYSCFMAHKYDEAIVQYQKALELEPDAITYFGLVLARAEEGDYATAVSEAEKATKMDKSPVLLTSLASAYARAGRRADANRVLRRLQEIWESQGRAPAWHTARSQYVCPYEVAGVYAQLGDNDRAFDWLDKAYRNRSCLYWLRVDPRFDSIRSDPRFQELLAKMNFPQ
jgi:eukaryotic-like serine/threonine-protein kinase